MEGLKFLEDLMIVLVFAGILGWICHRIGLSVVVGFLLAGIVVGPHTPPFLLVSDQHRIQTLSQLGLVFLMFSVGMGLSISRLRRMGFGIVAGTALAALVVFGASRLAGSLMGWTSVQSLFLAAMFMVSSSAIINKVLHEIGATHEPAGRMALSITVLEDIVAVAMLTLLTSVTRAAGAAEASLPQTLGLIVAFVIVLVIAGLLLVPRLLGHLARTSDSDLQTVLITGLMLSVALLAVKAGYSLALGAFLLGAIVAETSQRSQVERYLQGLRDIFTAVFFVSIGMMMDVQLIARAWPLVLLFGFATVLVRTLAWSGALVLIGHPSREAVRSGLMLTPIGEFSFIIAQLGVAAKVAPDLLYPIAVGVSFFTALTTPFLIKHSDAISRGIERAEPLFLKELIRIYHEALERIRERQQGNVVWQLSRKRLAQIATGFLFVTGLLAFARPINAWLVAHLASWLPFLEIWRGAFWAVLGMVVLVPLLAIWRNLMALSMIYAEAMARGGPDATFRTATQAALQAVFATAMAIWLWVLLPFGRSTLWTAAVVAVLVVLLLYLLRRRLVFLHSRVEVQLQEILSSPESRSVQAHQEWLQPHREWNIHVHEVVLPDHAECAGSTLSELALRSRFGCSVAGVERHGFPIPNPPPDLILYPGDKLLLLATPAQIAGAREFIGRTKAAREQSHVIEEIELERVLVPPDGPAAGKLLVELEIPAATGVQIVGIERNGKHLLNPGPFQGIEPGDALLALGTHRQIAEFQRWLQHEPA
jgi:CPA2 family monovalent cation:H+ antiporter-2